MKTSAMWKLILSSLLLCIVIIICPVHSQTPPTFFGMDIHPGVLNSQPWPSVPMGSIRLWDAHTTWNDLEPSKGVYAWPNLDGYLALAQANNVDVLYTFGGTAEWAASGSGSQCGYGPGSCYPPSNLQDWDDFVTAVVAHSAGKIKYWELWNEANLPEFWTGDVPTMVEMAQHAYAIIKAANPTAVVLSPSSTGAAIDVGTFLNKYFVAGGLPYTDAVAFHGYPSYNHPSAPEGVVDFVAAVKASMAANGIAGKPIWDTEASWGLNTNLTNPTNNAGYLAREFLVQWSSGVSRFYWYAWNNTAVGTLWTSDGVQPAGVAYGQLYNWMVGATMSSPCTMASDSTWTCTFTRPGGYQALAIWNSATTSNYAPASQYKQYLDLGGNKSPVNGTVTIGYNPVLLLSATPPAPPTITVITVQ
jgi:polysaccharide biosynthesis protein PslG